MRSSLAAIIVACFYFGCEHNPYVQGARLYDIHCSNCHMSDGVGLGSLYPPLNGELYRERYAKDLACIIRYGLSDSIVVGIQTYDTPMEGKPKLSATEIANIFNFIAHTWHEDLSKVTEQEMTLKLGKCADSR